MKQHIFVGDSLTEWAHWELRFPSDKIINLGIAGDTVSNMKRRCSELPLVKSTPLASQNHVWVMAGINDILQGFPMTDVIKHYTDMLNTWPAEVIQIQSTLLVGSQYAELNPLVNQLNRALEVYAIDHQIPFHDINKQLNLSECLSEQMTSDGVHLSELAYTTWYKYLTTFVAT